MMDEIQIELKLAKTKRDTKVISIMMMTVSIRKINILNNLKQSNIEN